MAKKKYQVMVDQWGANPAFDRGRVLELDLDNKDAMAAFPLDARYALENGVLLDLDAEAERMKAQRDADAEADRRAQAQVDAATGDPAAGVSRPSSPPKPKDKD